MRNNRGEWDYREPNDVDNYKFVRNSGIKSWEIDSRKAVWTEIKWLAISILSTVVFSLLLSFFFWWLMGGE